MTGKPAYDPTTQPYDEPFRHVERRLINCEVCDTEGRILRSSGGPDDIDYGVCPACNGKCEVEVEDEPITLEDLDNWECEDCIGMKEHGCYCKAVGAIGPGGPLKDKA